MNRVILAAKTGFAVLSVLGTAALVASPAHAGPASSASGAAVVTTPSGRTISVSGEVVSPFSNFNNVVVTPTFTTDATDTSVVTSITSLNVAPTSPTAVAPGSEAAAILETVYDTDTGSALPAGTTDEERLGILRTLVSGGALD